MNDDLDRFLRKSLADMNFTTDGLADSTALGPSGLDVDSLGRVEIAMRVSDDYGVTLTEDEVTAMADLTFGQMVALLRARIGGAGR